MRSSYGKSHPISSCSIYQLWCRNHRHGITYTVHTCCNVLCDVPSSWLKTKFHYLFLPETSDYTRDAELSFQAFVSLPRLIQLLKLKVTSKIAKDLPAKILKWRAYLLLQSFPNKHQNSAWTSFLCHLKKGKIVFRLTIPPIVLLISCHALFNSLVILENTDLLEQITISFQSTNAHITGSKSCGFTEDLYLHLVSASLIT